jgi:hypothetical protein
VAGFLRVGFLRLWLLLRVTAVVDGSTDLLASG